MPWPWSKKTERRPAHGPNEFDGGCGAYGLEVVGESQYQPALRRAWEQGRRQRDERGESRVIGVRVEREPTNPVDAKAVRVATLSGETVGYLSADQAKTYQGVLQRCEDAGRVVTCAAVLHGPDELRPGIGVWLDLLFPMKLKAALTAAGVRP